VRPKAKSHCVVADKFNVSWPLTSYIWALYVSLYLGLICVLISVLIRKIGFVHRHRAIHPAIGEGDVFDV
jgi:hypothetical protein